MATDPVCKMNVDPETAKWSSDYHGQRYYFCAPGCKSAFDADPEKYLGGGGKGHGHGGHGGHGHSCCGGH